MKQRNENDADDESHSARYLLSASALPVRTGRLFESCRRQRWRARTCCVLAPGRAYACARSLARWLALAGAALGRARAWLVFAFTPRGGEQTRRPVAALFAPLTLRLRLRSRLLWLYCGFLLVGAAIVVAANLKSLLAAVLSSRKLRHTTPRKGARLGRKGFTSLRFASPHVTLLKQCRSVWPGRSGPFEGVSPRRCVELVFGPARDQRKAAQTNPARGSQTSAANEPDLRRRVAVSGSTLSSRDGSRLVVSDDSSRRAARSQARVSDQRLASPRAIHIQSDCDCESRLGGPSGGTDAARLMTIFREWRQLSELAWEGKHANSIHFGGAPPKGREPRRPRNA
ncbi:Hypothetical predicted protein [Olea europaea subsp. europaea]|uniref:Uncharacterized protein n=1 Tax=Olea europaea subsp. europaea TaxID=158383 RepID=A0A8S0TNF9_OLEEU|nr:Hypothetical predicted protein [Olea europaea subsp. europaea]